MSIYDSILLKNIYRSLKYDPISDTQDMLYELAARAYEEIDQFLLLANPFGVSRLCL